MLNLIIQSISDQQKLCFCKLVLEGADFAQYDGCQHPEWSPDAGPSRSECLRSNYVNTLELVVRKDQHNIALGR